MCNSCARISGAKVNSNNGTRSTPMGVLCDGGLLRRYLRSTGLSSVEVVTPRCHSRSVRGNKSTAPPTCWLLGVVLLTLSNTWLRLLGDRKGGINRIDALRSLLRYAYQALPEVLIRQLVKHCYVLLQLYNCCSLRCCSSNGTTRLQVQGSNPTLGTTETGSIANSGNTVLFPNNKETLCSHWTRSFGEHWVDRTPN